MEGSLFTQARGQGWGKKLLIDALLKVVAISQSIGCLGVIVDAKNEAAQSFYERYGFQTTFDEPEWPKRMFLPLSTIKSSMMPQT